MLKRQLNPSRPDRTGYLRIGDIARLLGVSPSLLRSWEKLGLLRPPRTRSHYRLYGHDDVQLLKRALFLRRVRGLNAAGIVHVLRSRGRLPTAPHTTAKSAPEASYGQRLRQLRLQQGLSLASVAGRTGVSVGFLSSLERSRMSASVGTLRKLARFYNINILSLFDASVPSSRKVRPEDRKQLEAGPGVSMELLAWGNTVMEPHLFRVAPGAGSGEAYSHEGEEFLYLLRGQLRIALDGGEEVELSRGDSFYFESSIPHRWVNRGKEEAFVLWVNTPPTF